MRYRRARVAGGTFFFTVVTWQRRPLFQYPRFRRILGEALRAVREHHPFQIDAAVLLPDHMHCIWTLPDTDSDYSLRWRLIKRHVTTRAGSIRVWQRRYWEHVIRDEGDFRNHVDYIHYNPVHHGHVKSPVEWPWSSFSRFVRLGAYPADWGQGVPDLPSGVGGE